MKKHFLFYKGLSLVLVGLVWLLSAGNAQAGWSSKASLPLSNYNGADLAYPLSGDYIYSQEGNGQVGFVRYSISNNTWAALTPVPSHGGGVNAGGSLVYLGSGDYLYSLQGNLNTGLQRYSISGNSWTTLANAPATIAYGGGMAFPGSGDCLYVLRGNTTDTLWCYSIANDNWTALANAPGLLVDGGKLVSTGNDFLYALQGGSTVFLRYSISGNSWTTMAATPNAIGAGGAIVHDGGNYIYAFKGGFTNNFYRYDIAQNSWATLTGTPVTVSGGSALVRVANHKFYALTGGSDFWMYNIDETAPTGGTVADNGQFQTNNDSISASWYGFTDTVGVTGYSYSAYLADDGVNALVASTTTNNTSINEAFFDPGDGKTIVVYLQARDDAGNWSSVVNSNGITIDTTAPTTGTASDDGTHTSSTTTLSASWTGFSDATSGLAEYSYSIGTSAGGTTVRDWTSAGTNTSVSATGLNLTSGTQYFINVRAKDNVGNLSTVASTNGITIDTTAPTAGTASDDGTYTGSSTTLSASWTGFSDAASGIAEYSYSIGTSAGGTTVRDWTSVATNTNVSATGLNLTSGTQYFINVRAKDNVGNLSTVASTNGITIDTTAPTAGTASDDGAYTGSSTTLGASWTGFSDTASGIAEYSYSIGTSAGGTTVRDWTSVATNTNVSATGLSLTSATQYFFNIRAKDNVGNLGAVASTDGITVDTTAPVTGTVSNAGATTNSSTQLTATIAGFSDALSGIARYDYSIGITAGGATVRDWTDNGAATTVTAAGLNLTDGTQYFINVRAVDNAGNTSTVASTGGVTYVADAAVPTAGTVTDDGQFTASTTTLSASWTGFSDNTAIIQYEYSIGTSAGGTTVRDWTTVPAAARAASIAVPSTSVSATGLNLTSAAQYFFNVRAKDAANNVSTAASTDGITVDTASPTTGTVSDEGTSTNNGTQLVASWTGFADALSGIARYDYSIGTSAGDASVRDWISAGTSTTVTATGLNLTDRTVTYYVNIRAVDNVNNTSTVISTDGIIYIADATAPTPGTITDDGQFTSNTTTLNASWTGFSDNTEITQYEYSIGTSAGGASVRDWTTVAGAARVVSTAPLAASLIATGLSLANGSAYFINIRAKDAAANTSTVASTDGITVDTAAPVTGTVSDEGTSTSSKTQLTATWTGFSDAVSGIAEYSYSIGTSAGDTSIKTWTSAGTAITATATGLSLTYGNTYYLNVRASDALGQLSTVASSDGIQVISVGGDMDSDGDIDKADALLANKFATGKGAPTSAQILFADVAVPKDGKITTEDANLILRCANGTIRGKAEFPWCPALAREAAALPAQGNEGGAP